MDEKETAFRCTDSVGQLQVGVTQEEIASLYVIGKGREVRAGEVLIREGEVGNSAFIILDGSLKITKNINNEESEIARLSAGEWVGEIAFMRGTRRVASAVAIEPTTVLEINENAFNKLEPEEKLSFFKKLNEISNRRFNELVNEIFRKLKDECKLSSEAGHLTSLVSSLESALTHYMKTLKLTREAMEEVENELSVTAADLKVAVEEKERLYGELQKYTRNLEKKVVELEIRIDEKKKARELKSITESDYFKSLTEKIEDLNK